MKKIIFLFLISLGYFLIFPSIIKPALAVRYSLVAPSGTLVRGQTVRFTINIDTQGATIKTGTIGMTYDTQFLEYSSTTPGTAMPAVSSSQPESGKIVFSGENTSGFSGQGIFAYVDFKLIAQAPGSTELCVLWAPSTTPTPGPTATPGPSSTPGPTSPPQATTLPTSGDTRKAVVATSIGLGFVTLFGIFYYLDKQIAFKKPKKK